MKVYVNRNEQKVNGLYHHYFIEEPETQFTEHCERQNDDGSFMCIGDYMVGPELFSKENAIEIRPSECTPSVIFRNKGLVVRIPAGDDHENGGIVLSEFVRDEPTCEKDLPRKMKKNTKKFIKENTLACILPILQFTCLVLSSYNAFFIHKNKWSTVWGTVASICWAICICFSLYEVKRRWTCFKFYEDNASTKECTKNDSEVIIVDVNKFNKRRKKNNEDRTNV